MKKIIVILIILILAIPSSIIYLKWQESTNQSWNMKFNNPQLNPVLSYAGPTNFEFLSSVETRGLTYIVYNDLIISLVFYQFHNTTIAELKETNQVVEVLWKISQLYSANSPFYNNFLNPWNLPTYLQVFIFTIENYLSTIVIYNNIIYFIGTDGYLYALTLEGKLLWNKYIGPEFFIYVTAADRTLYLESLNLQKSNYSFQNVTIYGINTASHNLLFAFNGTFGQSNYLVPASIIPTYNNKILYISFNNELYALNAENGNVLFNHKYPNNITNFLTAYNGNIYTTFPNSVSKMNGVNGNIVWNFNVSEPSPLTIYQNKVVFATANGYTYEIDAQIGSLVWATYTGLGVLGSTVITSNNIIYEVGGWVFIPENVISRMQVWNVLMALNFNSGSIIDNFVSIWGNFVSIWGSFSFKMGENLYTPTFFNGYVFQTFDIPIIVNNKIFDAALAEYGGFTVVVGPYIPIIYILLALSIIVIISVITYISYRRIKKNILSNK